MKPFLSAIILGLSTMLPLHANASEELAKQYLELPAMQKMVDEMFTPATLKSQLAPALPGVSDDKLDKITALMSEELTKMKPEMQTMMLEGATETYSDGELQAMIDFYSTEIGAEVLVKTGKFTQSYMAEMGPMMQSVMQKMGPQVAEIMSQ